MKPSLSWDQTARLLAGDWATTGPLRINERLTVADLSAAVVLVNARRLLSAVEDAGGVEAAADCSFTEETAGFLARRLWWGESGDFVPEPDDLAVPLAWREPRPIQLLRAALQAAGALARAGQRLVVTPVGSALVSPERGGVLYACLLRAYFRDLDHEALDGEPAIPEGWRHVAYALWTLQWLREWEGAGSLVRTLLPAQVMAAENERLRALRVSRRGLTPNVEELLLLRLLDPLRDFALVKDRYLPEKGPGWMGSEFRRGSLYDRVLRFDW